MIDYNEVIHAFDVVLGASGTIACAGIFSKLFSRSPYEDDDEFIECHEIVTETLANSDRRKKIEAITGRDLAKGITKEELQKLQSEYELRQQKYRN